MCFHFGCQISVILIINYTLKSTSKTDCLRISIYIKNRMQLTLFHGIFSNLNTGNRDLELEISGKGQLIHPFRKHTDTSTGERRRVPLLNTDTQTCLLNHSATHSKSLALMSATSDRVHASKSNKPHRRHRCHFIWTFLQPSYSWLNSTHKASPERPFNVTARCRYGVSPHH